MNKKAVMEIPRMEIGRSTRFVRFSVNQSYVNIIVLKAIIYHQNNVSKKNYDFKKNVSRT